MPRNRDRPGATSPATAEPFPIPPRTLLHPAVLLEFVFGLSPLGGIAFWGWDTFNVVMLHLLAMAVQAAFLALRAATLSPAALGYFRRAGSTPSRAVPAWVTRVVLAGLVALAIGLPLLLFAAILVEQFGAELPTPVETIGDFWRIVVVSSGTWIPLAVVALLLSGEYLGEMIVTRVPLVGDVLPKRRIGAEWAHLDADLQAFIFVRAQVVLQMIVTVLGVGIGFVVSGELGVIAVALLLVALKTAVAVFLSAGAVVDARNEAGRTMVP